MDRRTFESPMDWEYQNSGPVDASSPFTQVAKSRTENLFSSPSKPTLHQNAFSSFGTPSKPPQSSLFNPQLSRAAAPPFRNPAFTTPRKFDDAAFSEASGAEESPALTETSDLPNDTPDADRMADLTMGGTITPSKVDKASRYSRSPKKHISGRGEIRSPRKGLQILRKRKRQNYDRDVGSVVKHRVDWDDGASDSDMSITTYDGPSKHKQRAGYGVEMRSEGWFAYILRSLSENPMAPDNIYQWFRVGLNAFIAGFIAFCGYRVIQTVRSDLQHANQMARMEIMSRISECQNHYTENECGSRTLPALRAMCDQWYDCMSQDADAVMKVKVTVKQVGVIINDFVDTLNYKAWGLLFALLAFSVVSNVMLSWTARPPTPPPPTPSAPISGPDVTSSQFRERFETPRHQRYMLIEEDGTDTDASPPKLYAPAIMFTPSGRRSPSKGERPRSPVKYYARSPSKDY